MKLIATLAAAALLLPATAGAQSIADTHVLAWYPAGKTPSSTYRLRDKPVCKNQSTDQRAAKAQAGPKSRCPAIAASSATPASAN